LPQHAHDAAVRDVPGDAPRPVMPNVSVWDMRMCPYVDPLSLRTLCADYGRSVVCTLPTIPVGLGQRMAQLFTRMRPAGPLAMSRLVGLVLEAGRPTAARLFEAERGSASVGSVGGGSRGARRGLLDARERAIRLLQHGSVSKAHATLSAAAGPGPADEVSSRAAVREGDIYRTD
jgi:hypothetical protein